MPKLRVTSPARSQGDIATPKRKKSRGSRSLCSPALSTASGRLTSLVDQFKEKNMESFALSPLNGKSVLTDDTDIQEPKRKSWWKKLNESSHVLEVLKDNKVTEANDVIEEFIDIEVLSQEKKSFSLDLPESSDSESIDSIVLPQRKLFTQKDNKVQKKFGQLGGKRETLAKLHKTNTTNIDKTVNVGTRELFQNKRSKPVFPAALLNMSPNRTAADKTKENILADPKPQVRNIFGNRPATKRKNMFADFIVSESEDEIPEIQPKVFGFQKEVEKRRMSSVSKGRDHSPTSSITTDMEMDDWRLLPSSTMVENQLEEMVAGHTPIKRARLSKLSEAKESEAGTNTVQSDATADKTKQSNKSVSSKNKSKTSPSKETLDTSRTTRSMTKNTSKYEEVNTSTKKQDTKINKSQNKTANKDNKLEVSNAEKSQRNNRSKARNSSKLTENEILTDENNAANAINNATRVINKSTSKKLSSSQVTNKSLKELNKESGDNEEINIEAQNISNEQIMEEDDENNLTLEYDEGDMEEAVVQNQQKSHKENVSIKNTTKADINKSKAQATLINETLNQKQKQSITVDESAELQQSTQDNVDGNLEHEPEDEQNENDSKGNRESIEEANICQTENDVNEELDSKANASANEEEENVHEETDDLHNNQEIEQADESHNDDNQVDEEQEHDQQDEEGNESQENENNVSHETDQEIENEEIESQEVEADESQVIEEDNVSHVSNQEDDEANESQKQEEQDESQIEENAESDEEEQEGNVSQEVDDSHVEEENESQEVANQTVEAVESEQEVAESEAEVAESDEEEAENEVEAAESEEEGVESEEEAEESEVEVEVSDAGEEDANESMQADESEQLEEVNQSQEVNESQEIDNEEKNNEENESANEQVDEDEASDESDRAIASDPEISVDDNQEEMEVDDDNDQASNEAVAESEPNESEPLEGVAGQSTEEIEESPNVTHDTTGRNRKKKLIKSPEAILHDKTNQMDSFTVKGRNTSVRKTKSIIQNLDIRPSLAPRDSIGSDGTRNSSAEGSGWDSHRTTRKTLRQTFGKDFTPRKSLRAMVMEKSAKRQTEMMDAHYVTAKFPQANSTELPEDSNRDVADFEVSNHDVSDHEVSKRTRQTTLEVYLEKMKQQNIEKKLKMEEAVRNSLKAPVRDTLSLFKVPSKPAPRRPKPTQSKPKKQIKSVIAFDELPSEVIEDMKYKPPKRFQPTNASWITKRLYKFLENKLEPNYDYKARVRAEKLVETIYHFAKDLRRHDVAPSHAVDVLKHELARLEVVNTHFEFYEFFHEFMPREVRVKVVPDIVNNIPLPRHGVFSAILRGNTVQG